MSPATRRGVQLQGRSASIRSRDTWAMAGASPMRAGPMVMVLIEVDINQIRGGRNRGGTSMPPGQRQVRKAHIQQVGHQGFGGRPAATAATLHDHILAG
jgi:hypothetical protein